MEGLPAAADSIVQGWVGQFNQRLAGEGKSLRSIRAAPNNYLEFEIASAL